MVQLVGYYTWQAASRRDSDAVEPCDAERGVERARKSFDSMVIEPALRRVSGKQFEYLAAMARCGSGPVSSGEVAREMGADPSSVGSYRGASLLSRSSRRRPMAWCALRSPICVNTCSNTRGSRGYPLVIAACAFEVRAAIRRR